MVQYTEDDRSLRPKRRTSGGTGELMVQDTEDNRSLRTPINDK